jgi:hypothetical protein
MPKLAVDGTMETLMQCLRLSLQYWH